MYNQKKSVHQWAKHIRGHFLCSDLKNNMNMYNYDYNMRHLLDQDQNGNFVVSEDFVKNLKISMGLPTSCNLCQLKTLFIDDSPVMAFKLHPSLVDGLTYNIIVNPRVSSNECVYACNHYLV